MPQSGTVPAECVDVLLATYNGASYLKQQIESIIAQDYGLFRILVHDDGSTDDTQSELEKLERLYADKLTVIRDGIQFKSSKGNFLHLLELATADYVAFCDQDDVWTKNHLSALVEAVRAEEAILGLSSPIGAFGDLKVVDKELQTIADSFWQVSKFNIARANTARYISCKNVCTGCCLMINRAAVTLSLAHDTGVATMHDHFIPLAILGSVNGRLVPVPMQLVLYRQHENNVIGAQIPNLKNTFCNIILSRGYINRVISYYRQSRYFGIHQSFLSFLIDKIVYKLV